MSDATDLGAFVGEMADIASGAATGPLAGSRVGVKDLFDVAGTVTGAGNPTYAGEHVPATAHAPAVGRLVDAGATIVGKTVTDELAFSLSGTNVHHGTPLNSAAPGHIPGGSSAGSAAAVAGGLVDLALGTDTAGSVRIPASYCSIIGWRSTHGSIPMEGVVPLAPSFDTVGVFAQRFDLLRSAAEVLLAGVPRSAAVASPLSGARLLAEAFDGVDPTVADALRSALASSPVSPDSTVGLGIDLGTALEAQRTIQMREAWLQHGDWLRASKPDMGPGIAARFAAASTITDADVDVQRPMADAIRARMHELLAAGPLIVPAAAGTPPPLDRKGDRSAQERIRTQTLQLTCTAGLAGAPVVVIPAVRLDGLPIGLAIIGRPGQDLELIDLAAELSRSIQTPPSRS